jgi:alpha-L-fucosidase
MRKKNDDYLAWWREARFGMFIHWGLYAVPAGVWKGEEVYGTAEWIMYCARIPVQEYEQLAKRFNPVRFDAREWVALAKEAGMKYIVITSKHHDGFAMYDSEASDFNIKKSTPYNKDPMKDLAKACALKGIKLCFYYSQTQDWHEPGGGGTNMWDFPTPTKKTFTEYLESKVKPQVTELLTQYGPIGLIWFDTPGTISRKQSLELKELVHSLQPDCLVSGRIGHDIGDYGSFGDNRMPSGPVKGDWEAPVTMNDTWGFQKRDKEWKSTKDLLVRLVDFASKGVNYLLNVGPTAQGVIPAASVKRLKEIGEWMKAHGEAIYGSEPNPFPYEMPWGRITCKADRMYLFFYEWPKTEFRLKGLNSRVKKAYTLGGTTQDVEFSQSFSKSLKEHTLAINLPSKKPDRLIPVVALEISGNIRIDRSIQQQPDGSIHLPAHLAKLDASEQAKGMQLDVTGILIGWEDRNSSVRWEFKIYNPGKFRIELSTAAIIRPRIWSGGQTVELLIKGPNSSNAASDKVKTSPKKLRRDEILDTPRTKYLPEVISKIGAVDIKKAGTYTLEMKVLDFGNKPANGLQLSYVRLAKTSYVISNMKNMYVDSQVDLLII